QKGIFLPESEVTAQPGRKQSYEKLSVLALSNGVNVIVEKPMTMTFESAQRMVQAAEKNKKQLLVHQSSRWDREYLAIKNIISSGKIGDVLVIQARVLLCDEFWPSWGIDGMANPWRVKAEYGGGMLYDWGPHLVDQVLQLIPEDPISVYGMLQSGVWSKEVDDHFFAILRYKSNVMAQLEVSNNGRINSPRWYVIATKGTIAVPGKSEPFWDEVVTNYIDRKGKKQIEKIKLVDVKESGLEGGFYQDLIPYLNGEIKNHVSMYDAAKVIKVLELIKKSSEENRVLKID
ncbi:MAG: Gfo/Idh/MocA family oxidoreductase, partial [Candidatus Humimicrobiaceae bacterium]